MPLAQESQDMKPRRVPEATLYGVKTLDDQHYRLFDLIEKIASLANTDDLPAIETLFGEVLGLMAKHFSDEEQLMIETQYSNAREHSAQHRSLLAEIDRIRKGMSDNKSVSKRDSHDAVDRIIRHMLLVDGPFKTHLKRIGYRAGTVKVSNRSAHTDSVASRY